MLLPVVRTQYTYVKDWPAGLHPASYVSEKIGVSEERLSELSEAMLCPHWRVDDGAPMYKLKEVKDWATANLLQRCEGDPLPLQLRIMVDPPLALDAPECIREIERLREIAIGDYPPGVYFLTKGQEVVYIGQSVNPLGRVNTHCGDPYKDFDRAYMLPVPRSMLDDVEGALIRTMRPKLNGTHAPRGNSAISDQQKLDTFVYRTEKTL